MLNRQSAIVTLTLLLSSAQLAGDNVTASQGPAAPAHPAPAAAQDAEIVRLKAQVFELRAKLATVEQQLGAEKARRAELEIVVLREEAQTLPAAVRTLLGLPVAEKPPGPSPPTQAPPTEKAPPKE